MATFKCPSCSKISNKMIMKCPDCGFIRMKGTEIAVDGMGATTIRELRKERRLADSKFRGGRNKGFFRHSQRRAPRGQR